MACFIEKIKKSTREHKYLAISALIYFRECDIEGKMAKQLQPWASGVGLDWESIPFKKVKEMKSITIECDILMLYIDYNVLNKAETKFKPLIFMDIPLLTDTINYIWKVDDELLRRFQKTETKTYYYSDDFEDGTVTLVCIVNDYRNVKLRLKLMKCPYGYIGYGGVARFKAHTDQGVFTAMSDSALLLRNYGNNECEAVMFTFEKLSGFVSLSFEVEFKIDNHQS